MIVNIKVVLLNSKNPNMIKGFNLCLFIFLFLFRTYAKDSTSYRCIPYKAKSFYGGILLGIGHQGMYVSNPGRHNDYISVFKNVESLFAEYFPIHRLSVFTSFVHSYEYYHDTSNLGSIGGIVGLRYYFPFQNPKKRKVKLKPTQYYWYLGIEYGKGHYYNPPNLRSFHHGSESAGDQRRNKL